MWVKNCIKEHFLSLIGGDSYHNALLMIKGCYPQQRWSDCVCTGGKTRLRLLAEQTRQQRNEGDAHQSNTTASHELLHALRLGRGVIAAVAFHEVHSTPHAQTGTQCHNQSLQNIHCTIKEFHSNLLCFEKATLHTPEIRLQKAENHGEG